MAECKIKFIKNGKILFFRSGINSEDMQVIYRYLISTLLPSDLNLEVEESCAPARKDSSFFSHGIFITSKSSLKDSAISIDKVCFLYFGEVLVYTVSFIFGI